MKTLLVLIFMVTTTSVFAQSDDCSYYLAKDNTIPHQRMIRFLKKYNYHNTTYVAGASYYVKARVDRLQEVGSSKVIYQSSLEIANNGRNNFLVEMHYESSTSEKQAIRKLFTLLNREMDECREF